MPSFPIESEDAFGFRAVQTARQHLERLVEDGRLVADRHQARGYRLPEAAREPRIVLAPVLGRVPAGAPGEAIEDPDGYLPVDARYAPAGYLFVLRVRGESMVGAGVLPGDLVIVRRQPTAANGDVAVAPVENDATVKTFPRAGGGWCRSRSTSPPGPDLPSRGRRVEPRPESPAFDPIVLDAGASPFSGR